MEAMLNVKQSKLKQDSIKVDERKPVNEYLKNFSKQAAVFSQETSNSHAAGAIQSHISKNFNRNLIKNSLKKGLVNMMQAAKDTNTARATQ